MSKTQKFSITLIILFITLLASFSIYKLILKNNADVYMGKMQNIQINLSIETQQTNNLFENTDISPQTAEYLTPKIEKAYKSTQKSLKQIDKLTPPLQYKKEHQKIRNKIYEANKIYKDLFEFSDYLAKRTKNIRSIISILKNFQTKYSKYKDTKQISEFCKKTSKDLETQEKYLKNIKTNQKIMKSDLLYKYIDELKQSLVKLSKSLDNDNYQQFYESVIGIQYSYNNNWSAAFLQADKKEFNKLIKQIKKN